MLTEDLPYITKDLRGTGGIIRNSIEDFTVEEVPVFEPDGEGEHLFVNLIKQAKRTRNIGNSIPSTSQ